MSYKTPTVEVGRILVVTIDHRADLVGHHGLSKAEKIAE